MGFSPIPAGLIIRTERNDAMREIRVREGSLHVVFRIRENGIVELAHFTVNGKEAETEQDFSADAYYPIVEIQETGKSTREMHGYKHNQCSSSLEYLYRSHQLTENEQGRLLTICLENESGVKADYHMQFFTGLSIVRVWVSLMNEGTREVPLEYVSSFLYRNLCSGGNLPYYEKTDIFIPRSSWCMEAQWQKCDARDLNLSGLINEGYNSPGHGRNEFSYGGKSSWSSVDYLPMGMAADRESGQTWVFQIEHSGQWHAEYGSDFGKRLYVALSGATSLENGWWYLLKPGMSWSTVPVAFGAVSGEESAAIGELTRYRRAIRTPRAVNRMPPIVFNDYMNCLMGDPYEETEKKIIDLAAKIGCEYYCLDAGWYDKGYWWDRVGEWTESAERFPSGLKSVFDYARSRGLKMGLWLEIEVMGTACSLADRLPDDWFVCRHGRRHIDNKRYLLDFRNPAVREYCDRVIDRLVEDYGCAYFKIDYNVSMGNGSDLYTDSCAQAIRDHYENLYRWYEGVFERHPDLVIENCGSGGQRMDYGMLRLLSLQSTSDQTDCLWNSYIAMNVASAAVPEQAGMWVYPYKDEREHVIYNFVNGLLLCPYISGRVWDMSRENLDLMAEGVSLYKKLRGFLVRAVPFFPLGFSSSGKDKAAVYGLADGNRAYLAVTGPFTDQVRIPLPFGDRVRGISVIFPQTVDCVFTYREGILEVQMPRAGCGRLFEIHLCD